MGVSRMDKMAADIFLDFIRKGTFSGGDEKKGYKRGPSKKKRKKEKKANGMALTVLTGCY